MDAARRFRVVSPAEASESRRIVDQIFTRYWDDVAYLNAYTPETAQALLEREGETLEQPLANGEGVIEFDNAFNDPWLAVKLGLRERAAGRLLTCLA